MVDFILRVLIPERAAIAAAVLILCPMAVAQKSWDAPRVVTRNCSGCHEIDGNSQPPYFPRLAGLNAAFAEQRIAQFRADSAPPVDELFYRIVTAVAPSPGASKRETRINMVGIGHAIPEEETNAAAEWYAKQKPAPGRSGNPALIERGKALYLNGLPAQGLPACQTCHGPRAEGSGKIPRLAGQNGTYILGELQKFNAGDRQHAPEMTTVAKHVDSDGEEFRALAAYLQSL
jgi:cytochrome c553